MSWPPFLAGVESEAAGKEWLIGDGVIIDAASDSVVDREGNIVDVAALNVRELKAELSQRKLQVTGSKTILAKRLEKARRGGFDGAQKTPASEPDKVCHGLDGERRLFLASHRPSGTYLRQCRTHSQGVSCCPQSGRPPPSPSSHPFPALLHPPGPHPGGPGVLAKREAGGSHSAPG